MAPDHENGSAKRYVLPLRMRMETLGALIDKLSIINLKLWHCQETLFSDSATPLPEDQKKTLETKNTSLLGQRSQQIAELNTWMQRALEDPSSMLILNPQNKMYGRFRKDA